MAAVVGDGFGHERQDRSGHVEARMVQPRHRDAGLEDLQPQLFLVRAHLDDETAGEPRADAVVQAFEIGRGRSPATTTCRPASINALSVWQYSAWVDFPCRNCRSSITRTSMARSAY